MLPTLRILLWPRPVLWGSLIIYIDANCVYERVTELWATDVDTSRRAFFAEGRARCVGALFAPHLPWRQHIGQAQLGWEAQEGARFEYQLASRQGGPWWSGMNILQRLLDCCYMEAAQEILRCSEIEHCCNTKFVCRRQVHIFSDRGYRFIPSASLSIFSPNVEFDFFFEAFHLVLQLWAWARHNSHLSPRLAQDWQIRRVVIKSRTRQAEKPRNPGQI